MKKVFITLILTTYLLNNNSFGQIGNSIPNCQKIIILDTIEMSQPIIVQFYKKTDFNQFVKTSFLCDEKDVNLYARKLCYDSLLKTGVIYIEDYIFNLLIQHDLKNNIEKNNDLSDFLKNYNSKELENNSDFKNQIGNYAVLVNKKKSFSIYRIKRSYFLIALIDLNLLKYAWHFESGYIYIPTYLFDLNLLYIKIAIPLHKYSFYKL